MKKILFNLLGMVALLLTVNVAFAVNESQVYAGGTYDYSLSGVGSTNTATVTVTYSTVSGTTAATFGDITVGSVTTTTIDAGTVSTTVGFQATYPEETATATHGYIRVTVTDDSPSGCFNYIDLMIELQDPPTFNISLATLDGGCFAPLDTPPTDGSADAYAGGENTVTYTVSEDTDGTVVSFTFDYTISGSSTLSSTSGTQGDANDIVVTFDTEEGDGLDIVGSITGGTFTLNSENGGGTYDFTIGADATASFDPLPTIGAFN